jgi:hypothetical protein
MTPPRDIVPDDVLDRVACASLVDAMGRLHRHRAHILSLVSPAPRRLFGPVATIAYLPYRDDVRETELGFGTLFHQAMGESPAGTVLALSSGGYPDASHGGGTKLSRLHHHGAAGRNPGRLPVRGCQRRGRDPAGKPGTGDRRSADGRSRGREIPRGDRHRATYRYIARVMLRLAYSLSYSS